MGNDIDLDVLVEAYRIFEEELANRKDSDYTINDIQMKKLKDAYAFFCKIAEDCNGRIEPMDFTPKQKSAGVTVYLPLLYLNGELLLKFQKILGNIGALSIDATIEGEVCISFTIPNIATEKNRS